MAEGSNAVGVLIEEEGIMLIDSFPPSHSQLLLDEIRTFSDKPIKYVLPTHSHGDHSGGLNFFTKMGATGISQQNSIYHFKEDFFRAFSQATEPNSMDAPTAIPPQ